MRVRKNKSNKNCIKGMYNFVYNKSGIIHIHIKHYSNYGKIKKFCSLYNTVYTIV